MASQMQPSTSSVTTTQSTIHQELMKFIPSSDDQLNEISPPYGGPRRQDQNSQKLS